MANGERYSREASGKNNGRGRNRKKSHEKIERPIIKNSVMGIGLLPRAHLPAKPLVLVVVAVARDWTSRTGRLLFVNLLFLVDRRRSLLYDSLLDDTFERGSARNSRSRSALERFGGRRGDDTSVGWSGNSDSTGGQSLSVMFGFGDCHD